MDARRTRGIAAAASLTMMVAAAAAMVACSRPATRPVEQVADASTNADASANADANAGADADANAGADANANADAADDGASADAGSDATVAADAGTARARVVKIDESSAGKTLELAPGQTLVAMLVANPSTGYDWSVLKAPAALGAPDMGFVAGGEQPGAPGKRRIAWTLKSALPAGEHAVELGYARSFEKGVAPFKSFKFKVRAPR
jgi:predicted secreted protein